MEDLSKKYGYLRNKMLGSRSITYVQVALILTIVSVAIANSTIKLPLTVTSILAIISSALLFALGGVTLVRAFAKREKAYFAAAGLYLISSALIAVDGLYQGDLLGDGFNTLVNQITNPFFFKFLPGYLIIFSLFYVTVFDSVRGDEVVKISQKRAFWLGFIFVGSIVINAFSQLNPDMIESWGLSHYLVVAGVFVVTTAAVLVTLLWAKRWRHDSYNHMAVVSLIFFLFYGAFAFISDGNVEDIKMAFAEAILQFGIITLSIGQYIGLYDLLYKGEIQKELAIRQSRRLDMFNRATDTTTDMIVISDPEGVVVYANPAVTKITGFSLSEAMGSKAGTLWGKLMSPDFYKNMWDIIKVKKRPYTGILKNRRKNGLHYYAALNITPVIGADGNIQHFVAIERDITEERLSEKRKYDFLSIISHRLRTPLTTNKWSLEMLTTGDAGKLTKQQKELMTDLDQANERLIELVNLMGMITDLEAGKVSMKPEEVNLKDLVATVVENYKPKAKSKKLDIKLKSSAQLPNITCDKAVVTTILDQLISNAINYAPRSTVLELRVVNREGMILFEVADQGPGIPEDDKPMIFKSFYRAPEIAKSDVTGTGMGLYMTKLLTDTMGAKIWFESTYGIGSTFSVAFPLVSKSQMREVWEVEKTSIEDFEDKSKNPIDTSSSQSQLG